MNAPPTYRTMMDPEECLSLHLDEKVYALSPSEPVGELAAIGRQQALALAGGAEGPLTVWLPPATLKAVIYARVLVD